MISGSTRFLLLDLGGVIVRLDFNPLANTMRTFAGIEPARLQTMLASTGLVTAIRMRATR